MLFQGVDLDNPLASLCFIIFDDLDPPIQVDAGKNDAFSRIEMSVRDDGTPSSPQFADLARGASEQTPQDSQIK